MKRALRDLLWKVSEARQVMNSYATLAVSETEVGVWKQTERFSTTTYNSTTTGIAVHDDGDVERRMP